MKHPKYFTRLSQIPFLSPTEQAELEPVVEKFIFRSNDYYQSLIDPQDPNDPLRRVIVPTREEADEWGRLDASEEQQYTVVPGLEHKYPDTALLLVSDVCGGYCRFCFRKRLFMEQNEEVVRDVTEGLRYIGEHPEISEVLLTGGDPLVLSTEKLESIIRRLVEIPHVKVIRLGTKMPAFDPARILNDVEFGRMIERCGKATERIYFMLHFNHPRELTEAAIAAVRLVQRAGAAAVNQTPLIRGVNDDPAVLSELFSLLAHIGAPPYYVFQCRPTLGNAAYSVPLEEAYEIFTRARAGCSGLAGCARFVMSHATGKIEVLGLTASQIMLKYHRAADPMNHGRLLVFERNRAAHWLDDYQEAAALSD